MSDIKNIKDGAVTSIGDADLVMCSVGGSYHPISYGNLIKALRSDLNMYHPTIISAKAGDWVRVAAMASVNVSFYATLTVFHSWSSGKPMPVSCIIAGASNSTALFVNSLMSESVSEASNNGISFTALRFVKDDDNRMYVELQVSSYKSKIDAVYASLSGYRDITLIDASVSTVSDDKVLKTFSLLRGGG